VRIRNATEDDGAACAAIYAPYVTDTVITFEYDVPTAADMSARIAAVLRTHAWLVLEDDDRVVGYAYASAAKARAAYQWSCEVTVYLEAGRRRSGCGRALYTALFERLAERGFRQALAAMTLPNVASEGLHRAMGFEPIGVQRRIGWKHDAWHDVAWVQRSIGDDDGPPRELR